MASELTKKAPAEIELVRQTAYETALESFASKYDWFEGMDPAIMMAEAELAGDVEKTKRTPRERALVHLVDTMTSVQNAIDGGLITRPQDAEVLSDALVFGGIQPSNAIKYLKPVGTSNLERALLPRELATAISIHQDLAYMDETISIATIARIADETGISLEHETDEVDLDVLLGSLERYEGKVSLHIVEDDPDDGPVSARRNKKIAGATLATRSEAGTNIVYEDEKFTGADRVREFAELAGIEDAGEREDLYRIPEDK